MTSFDDLLNRSADDIKEPVTLPAGTYAVQLGAFEFGTSRQKETPYVEFQVSFNSPEDDVDEDELAEYAAFKPLNETKISYPFWLSDTALFMFKNFMSDVIGVPTDGKSLKALIDEVPGNSVLAQVIHRTYQRNDGTPGTRAEIAKFIAAD